MIQLRNLTLRRGPDPLLESADLTIHAGQKLGLVGANGCGKSSLFALLRGELHPDAGDVSLPADWTIASMLQETPALERPALEYVLDGDEALRGAERAVAAAESRNDGEAIARAHARFDAAGGYSARARGAELLHGLGFEPDVHQQPVAAFSGGWRVRLNLARALMCPSDLLLLDEPTNHLDLETVLWLEQWLRAYPGTLMLISHDRDFLDAVVDHVVHIEQRRLNLYKGGYSAFERQRSERLAQQQALHDKQQQEIARLERFIDRFRAKATKARAAQSRVKALERMEKVAPAHVDSPFHFEFREPEPAANPLMSLEDVAAGYDGAPVFTGVSMGLRPGARIGLLGPNGAGKSTLVKLLARDLEPLQGTLTVGRNVRIGYFAQHQLEQLDPEASPLLHLQRLAPGEGEQKLRDFLGGFGFQGDMATDPVAPFSGGEKARLVLALLVWQRPNLLLLDEPTNHLDLEMRHALTVALQGFDGATVTVSHDRHLLNSTVDEYWLVAEGAVARFHGGLEDYRRWLNQRRRSAVAAEPGEAPKRHSAAARREDRRRQAERRAALKPLRQQVDRLVRDLEAVTESLSRLEERMADPALYEPDGKERLTALLQEQGELRNRQQELENRWMEAEEELEAARSTA